VCVCVMLVSTLQHYKSVTNFFFCETLHEAYADVQIPIATQFDIVQPSVT